MINDSTVWDLFQRCCVERGGSFGLLFGEPGKKEVCSVKIIGKYDDPDRWLTTIKDVYQECLAYFELDFFESLSLEKGVNVRVLERICGRIANLAIANDGSLPENWIESLSRAEIALVSIMEKRGTMSSISDKVFQAGLLVV